jgi:uncharacterized membrane protein YraQ (UPF0718 family)
MNNPSVERSVNSSVKSNSNQQIATWISTVTGCFLLWKYFLQPAASWPGLSVADAAFIYVVFGAFGFVAVRLVAGTYVQVWSSLVLSEKLFSGKQFLRLADLCFQIAAWTIMHAAWVGFRPPTWSNSYSWIFFNIGVALATLAASLLLCTIFGLFLEYFFSSDEVSVDSSCNAQEECKNPVEPVAEPLIGSDSQVSVPTAKTPSTKRFWRRPRMSF